MLSLSDNDASRSAVLPRASSIKAFGPAVPEAAGAAATNASPVPPARVPSNTTWKTESSPCANDSRASSRAKEEGEGLGEEEEVETEEEGVNCIASRTASACAPLTAEPGELLLFSFCLILFVFVLLMI